MDRVDAKFLECSGDASSTPARQRARSRGTLADWQTLKVWTLKDLERPAEYDTSTDVGVRSVHEGLRGGRGQWRYDS